MESMHRGDVRWLEQHSGSMDGWMWMGPVGEEGSNVGRSPRSPKFSWGPRPVLGLELFDYCPLGFGL